MDDGLEMVGAAGVVAFPETVPVTTKSLPVWKLFKYQVPDVPLAPQSTQRKVTVVEEGRF